MIENEVINSGNENVTFELPGKFPSKIAIKKLLIFLLDLWLHLPVKNRPLVLLPRQYQKKGVLEHFFHFFSRKFFA